MTLADSIKSDVTAIFLQTDDFAETVTYYFRSGGSRSIAANIEREPAGFYEGEKLVIPSFVIDLHNNATTGVTISQLDTGGDQVAIKLKTTDTIPVKRPVIKVLYHDSGLVQIAVR